MFNFLCKYLHIYKITFLLYIIFNLNFSLTAFDFEKLPDFEQGVLRFEAGDKPAASGSFRSSLRKGNPLGYNYLKSMKSSGELELPPADQELFDNVPDICKDESRRYYDASLSVIGKSAKRAARAAAKKGKKAGRAAKTPRMVRKDAQTLYLEGLRLEAADNNNGAFVNYNQSFLAKNLRVALGFLRLEKCPEGTTDFIKKVFMFEKGRRSLEKFLPLLRLMGFNINSVILGLGSGIKIEDIRHLPEKTFRYFCLVLMRRDGILSEDLNQLTASYAQFLRDGIGGDVDLVGAKKYFLEAADKGVAHAQNDYASILYKEGGNRNLRLARKYYCKAAENGYSLGEFNYAGMLKSGEGGDDSLERFLELKLARAYMRKAADKGDIDAEHNYALMLSQSETGDENLELARIYFCRAAEKGNFKAEYNYAVMLEYGEGGDENLELARVCYNRAADKGCTMAERAYALMLYFGTGGPKNLVEAREYFRRAAEKGDVSATFYYGAMLYFGAGGKKSLDEAKSYLFIAAESGFVRAKVLLNCLETDVSKEPATELFVVIEEAPSSDDKDFAERGEDLPPPSSGAGSGAGIEAEEVEEGAPASPKAVGAGTVKEEATKTAHTSVARTFEKRISINTSIDPAAALHEGYSSLYTKLTPEILKFMNETFGKKVNKKIVPYLYDDIIDLFGEISESCKKVVFSKRAVKDFSDLMPNPKNRIYAEKVLGLIEEILTNPAGRPSGSEKLRGGSDCYSCRISKKHRLVYSLGEDQLNIIRCAEHYGRL
jgi:Txe/YoeB family toxin of toxin-antitoxin system